MRSCSISLPICAAALLITACANQAAAPADAAPAAPDNTPPATSLDPDKLDSKTDDLTEASTPAPVPTPSPSPPVSAGFAPDDSLSLCPRLTVRNSPPANADRSVTDYRPFIRVEDAVTLAVSPVNEACLTSGFGWRGMNFHKGLDLQSQPARMVHSGAAGTVLEAGYRDDYGHYVLIDHGEGVHTRSAHLAGLEPGVRVGAKLPFGAPLGLMSNTASYQIPVHLHYELLIGDYDNPKASFGLTPKSPFDYPFVDG